MTLPLSRIAHRQASGGVLLEPTLRLTQTSAARTVAITLDACPGHFDHRIADMLVARNIPATITLTAAWMQHNTEGLAFLKSRPDLFALENHGAQHLPPVLGTEKIYGLTPAGSLAAIRAEVLGGAEAIAAATGQHPTWYRGAAALYSPEAIPLIEQLGFRVAGYSLSADEGASLPAKIVAARMAAARDGDVIIGHINQPKRDSGAGIAIGLATLQDAGVTFIRLSDLTPA
ncbi:MAG TPA: polysaccharide deacetylase family protein [Acidocella sp.]|nr:polysaccharide deacetylase family protein [Acidocella sp.]HQU04636.1 polysaccharide deacetylase family protein [Acidocella sp.]